jgi:hypothetical protein
MSLPVRTRIEQIQRVKGKELKDLLSGQHQTLKPVKQHPPKPSGSPPSGRADRDNGLAKLKAWDRR